ncbi:hypothetical protein HC891_12340 [Candidatus Gracilibacteria bacterium]|nr:hypothetical protein [Candidatus Gracilibacteria bacterium]
MTEHAPTDAVLELRVALTSAAFERLLAMYTTGLGLVPTELWTTDTDRAVLLTLGRATVEISMRRTPPSWMSWKSAHGGAARSAWRCGAGCRCGPGAGAGPGSDLDPSAGDHALATQKRAHPGYRWFADHALSSSRTSSRRSSDSSGHAPCLSNPKRSMKKLVWSYTA